MKGSIGKKLLVGLVLFSVLVAGIGLYTLHTSERALEEAVGTGSVFLAEEMLRGIEQSVFGIEETVVQFTHDPVFQATLARLQAAPLARKEREALFARLTETFIDFSAVRYGYRQYSEAVVTNAKGAVVASTNDTTANLAPFADVATVADAVWWQHAQADGAVVGDFVYDETNGVWGVPLSVRVDSAAGEFLGVIRVVFPVGVIVRGEELASKKYDTTEIRLVTHDGRVIYQTGAFHFLEDISERDFYAQVAPQNGFFTAHEGGTEKLFSYAHAHNRSGHERLEWTLVVSHDTDEVFAAAVQLRILLAFALGLVFVGIGVLALWLSRSVSAPIRRLTETARAIAAGDRKQRATVASDDEIGVLGAAFNTMTDQLTDAIEHLEIGKAHDAAIFESFGDGLIVTDKHMIVRKVNAAALTLLGRKESDVVGYAWPDVLGTDGVVDAESEPVRGDRAPARAAGARGRCVHTDNLYYRRADHTTFPVAVTAAPIVYNSATIGVVEVFRDITAERTVESARSEFISFVAHQLRVPLSSTRVFLEKLLHKEAGATTAPQERYLGHINAATERMLVLIQSLLNVARLEGGRLQVEKQQCSLSDCVEAAIEGIEPTAALKDIRINFKKPATPTPVATDAVLLGEVLHNLLANAVQYTKQTPSEITVTLEVLRDEYRISVRDRGVGVAAAARDRIFEKFFQAAPEHATAHTGAHHTMPPATHSNHHSAEQTAAHHSASSGLGLYAAKLIMNILGGRIWFESPNREASIQNKTIVHATQNKKAPDPASPANHPPSAPGTTFHITIPRT